MLKKFTRAALPILLFVLCITDTHAQDARVKSADNEFIVELYRETTSVRIDIYFVDASKYSYLLIEKDQSGNGQFRQCAYINLQDQDPNGGAVEARDNHPLNQFDASYYRVRTVTLDRIERIYPPIRLPGTTEECHDGDE